MSKKVRDLSNLKIKKNIAYSPYTLREIAHKNLIIHLSNVTSQDLNSLQKPNQVALKPRCVL